MFWCDVRIVNLVLSLSRANIKVIKVAKKCKHIDSVKWHIVGDGRMKSWIENEILENSLENTIYRYGNFDISKMPAILESADALLIALKNNPIFEVTIPGKFQTYCTAGKPIISLAKGEVNKIVTSISSFRRKGIYLIIDFLFKP